MLRGLFVFFSSDSHVVNGSLGDEGCLAFVNTNRRHLKRRSGCRPNAEAQMTTEQAGHPTSGPGRGSAQGSPQLVHRAASASPPQGYKNIIDFKENHLTTPGPAPPFHKHQWSFCSHFLMFYEQSYNQFQNIPWGPIIITWHLGPIPKQSGICSGNFQHH